MPYNLLDEAWIPVRREDGTPDTIRPCQIAETENPPISLDAPRPDFNGALIQFLIGLVQTASAPRHEREWRKRFKHPPSPDELDSAFDWCRNAFYLDANPDGEERGVFMQDYAFAQKQPELKKARSEKLKTTSKQRPLVHLLFETPTGNTLKRNQDHFTKRRESQSLSVPEAAVALLNIQANAQGSGRGYRVSIRGKLGPLTTVVVGRTLWQTVWLNVLPKRDFEALASPTPPSTEKLFPWMAPAPTSEADHSVTPSEVHASQMYWAMPLRKRLLFERLDLDDARGAPQLKTHYYRTTHGINYDNSSAWLHPLSPQDYSRGRMPKPLSASKLAGRSYSEWLGLAANRGTREIKPALVVQRFASRSGYDAVQQMAYGRNDAEAVNDDRSGAEETALSLKRSRVRIWAFGYEFKDSNAEAWHEATMPLLVLNAPELRPYFEELAHDMVQAAEAAVSGDPKAKPDLRYALKRGLFGTYKKNSKTGRFGWDFPTSREGASAMQASIVGQTTARFWKDTETDFYGLLGTAQEKLNAHPDADPDETLRPLREKWFGVVREKTLGLFDEVTNYGTFRAADPRSVAQARGELRRTLYGKSVKGALK